MFKAVRLILVLAVASTLLIIPTASGAAAEAEEMPTCPLADGIILQNGVDWGPQFLRADQFRSAAVLGPVPIDLIPGDYNISLVSYDTHDNPDDDQSNERWFIEVFSGDESTYVSPAIADLPTDQQLLSKQVASNVRLSGDSITVNHFAFKDPLDNPQSVYALCASFERIGFIDDDNSIFESDIEWMFSKGYTRGCNPPDNNKFCPNDFVTRGQMAAFLTRALELTEQSPDNTFTDDDNSIFENDIEKLAAAGITKGCNPPTNDEFCPNDNITRAQMAAFLTRALDLTEQADNPFTDDDGSIFENDIEKLAAAGITKGCNPPDNDRYCPDNFVTRGQMAAFLRRSLS